MTTTAAEMKSAPPMSLTELRRRRKPLVDVNRQLHEKLKLLDRVALWITTRVGTMGFFIVIFAWTVIWLGWNLMAPKSLQFDPPTGFVFWLFISNLIQILLMPLIMVGQNIQGAHAEARAEHDLEVNVKAEEEIEVILQHLEYQNDLLLKMMSRLNVNLAQALDQEGGEPSPPRA